MHKNRKFISAILAGLTLFSIAPVRAAEMETVEEEPATVETQDNVEVQVETKLEEPVLNENGNIAEGIEDTVKWVINAEGTLTLSPENGVNGTISEGTTWASNVPWYPYRLYIQKIYATPGVFFGRQAQNFFNGLSNLTEIDLKNINTEMTEDMTGLFEGCSKLTSIQSISGWNTQNLKTAIYVFRGCSSLTSLEALADWNVSNLENAAGMFQECTGLTSLNGLENWKTSSLENLNDTFRDCSNLLSIDELAKWETYNLKGVEYLLEGCEKITSIAPLSEWKTSNLVNAWGMLFGLKEIKTLEPLRNWDVSNVMLMDTMFYGCSGITSLEPLSEWDTSNVTNMRGTFMNCSGLTSLEPLKNWDTSKTFRVNEMFAGCTNVVTADFTNWVLPDETPNTPYGRSSFLEGCESLSKISISSKTNFGNTDIPSPQETDEYTGRWAYGDPYNHSETLTGKEFERGESVKAGTWYWERKGSAPSEKVSASIAIKDNHNNFIEGTVVTITDNAGAEVARLTTDKEALSLPESLVLNNEYTINIESPFGYQSIEPQKITITGTAENPQTIEITLPLKQFNVTLNTTDSKGNPVSGGTASIYNAATDALIDEVDMNPGETVVLEYNPDGYYAIQTTVADGYRIDENTYEIKNDLSDQTITFINNLIEEGELEPVPTEKPDNTNQDNNNQNSNKVETGNYANVAIFAGVIAAVAVAIGIVLYLKKRNKDSEEA